MVEWLQAFYRHIGSRSVILTMDNLKAHINAIEQSPPPSNIHVIWLPKNSTSVFQPLDQGIINNLKVHYRKQWIRFIIDSIDNNTNPFTTVTLYQTIQWCSRAWYQSVNNTTIYQCFRKSTVIQPSIRLPEPPPVDLSSEYFALQQRIPEVMDLRFILHPQDEDGEEEDEQVSLADIIQQHIQEPTMTDEAIDEDVEPPPVIIPTPGEALTALQVLRTFQEHRDETQHQDLRYLDQFERHLRTIIASTQSQGTLDNWIT